MTATPSHPEPLATATTRWTDPPLHTAAGKPTPNLAALVTDRCTQTLNTVETLALMCDEAAQLPPIPGIAYNRPWPSSKAGASQGSKGGAAPFSSSGATTAADGGRAAS